MHMFRLDSNVHSYQHIVIYTYIQALRFQQITQMFQSRLGRDVYFDLLTKVTKPLTINIVGFVAFSVILHHICFYFHHLEHHFWRVSDMNFFRILLIRVFCDSSLWTLSLLFRSFSDSSKIWDLSLSSTWTVSRLNSGTWITWHSTVFML